MELGNTNSGLVHDILNNGYPIEILANEYNALGSQIDLTFLPNINYIASSIANPVTAVPGSLDFNAINFPLTMKFNANGDPNAQFFIIAAETIHFSGNNPITMVLENGALASNIFWLAQGTTPAGGIMWSNTIGSVTAYGNFISLIDEIALNNQGSTINGSLFHVGNGSQIDLGGNGSIVNCQGGPVVCYLKGTKILTQRGHIAIENICSTDRIVTKGKIINNDTLAKDNFKLEPIVWLSKFKVKQPSSESFPICIKQNALGPNRPFEDLFVSPNHGIVVKGKVVRAKDLVNDDTIFQDWSKNSLTYYHLELKNHSAIVANGVLSESYLDMENRYSFEPRESFEPIRKSETIIVKNKNKNKNINATKLVNFINQAVKTIKCNKKVQKQSNMIKTF